MHFMISNYGERHICDFVICIAFIHIREEAYLHVLLQGWGSMLTSGVQDS